MQFNLCLGAGIMQLHARYQFFPKSLALMRVFPVKNQRSILRRLSKDCCPRSLGFCFKCLVLPTTYKKKKS